MPLEPNEGLRRLTVEVSRLFSIRHTHTHTLGKTSRNEGSARCTELYMTTHSLHSRQTPMTTVRFEPAMLASKRPQTLASDRATTGNGVRSATEMN